MPPDGVSAWHLKHDRDDLLIWFTWQINFFQKNTTYHLKNKFVSSKLKFVIYAIIIWLLLNFSIITQSVIIIL